MTATESPALAGRAPRARVSRNAVRLAAPGSGVTEVPPTELDGRGFPLPKLVPAVLAALRAIEPGARQYVRTSGRPEELLRIIVERRIEGLVEQLPDSTWRTLLVSPPRADGA